MDYNKTNEKLDKSLTKIEEKIISTFDGNLNFIKNLRKYVTNEYKLFEDVIIKKSIQLGVILLVADVLLSLAGYKSILGMIPKLLAVLLLVTYTYRGKLRRKN